MTIRTLNRRNFLRVSTGIVVAFPLFSRLVGAMPEDTLNVGSLKNAPMLDAWLRIGADGAVTVFTGKVEIGQGILTAIAQIAANELNVNMARIQVISGDTEAGPDEGWTAGSLSIEHSGMAVRHAAAEARQILLQMAANQFGQSVNSLSVTDGTVTDKAGHSVTYWVLAEKNPLHREASMTQTPKQPGQGKLTGKSIGRIDLPGKFSGAESYLQDIKLPGMVHGRVVRPPYPDATLETYDELNIQKIRHLPGVLSIVRDGSFIGVIAEREEQAVAARVALLKAVKWRHNPEQAPTLKQLSGRLRELPHQSFKLAEVKATDNPVGVMIAKRVRAAYSKPFIAHASIGPSAAIAHFEQKSEQHLTLWTHSQAVFPLRRALSKVLAIPEQQLHIKHAEGSGCYGHNGQDDVALDAALLARSVPGRPVRVQWMRDDEFGWEPLGSAMEMELDCGLSADGRIVQWNYEFWTAGHAERADIPPGRPNLLAAQQLENPFPREDAIEVPLAFGGGGSRNAVPYYSVPAVVSEHLAKRLPIRTSSLRSLGAYANVFAIESMMDELAATVGTNPLEFRLKHLEDPRARHVLQVAAQQSDWYSTKLTKPRGRGLAFSRYKNKQAYVAMIADVEVDFNSGRIRVLKITTAVDGGEVINPDGFKNQIEGGIVQALSWTLKESVCFDDAGVGPRSWGDYPILRFSEVPEIEVVLIETPGAPPLGAGEPSVAPVAAAIANAVAATGLRLRHLPLTPECVLEAVEGW